VTTQGNNLLLVAVDGRRPDYSVGTSFVESARIMKALEAEGTVNLACELVENTSVPFSKHAFCAGDPADNSWSIAYGQG
jgi:hypothetical protein